MKTSTKRKKVDFGKYPQILIRTDIETKAWFARRATLAGQSLGDALKELRVLDERREVANAAKRNARRK